MRAIDMNGLGDVLYIAGYTMLLFIGTTLLAMALVYVMDLHLLLKRFIAQNEGLLDGMHEGLLILDNDTN